VYLGLCRVPWTLGKALDSRCERLAKKLILDLTLVNLELTELYQTGHKTPGRDTLEPRIAKRKKKENGVRASGGEPRLKKIIWT
jgi:hypothetical protein